MFIATPILNHGGDAEDNPILAGVTHKVTLHKHDAAETLKRCWVRANGSEVSDLTARCVETEADISVDVVAGTDTLAGTTSETWTSALDDDFSGYSANSLSLARFETTAGITDPYGSSGGIVSGSIVAATDCVEGANSVVWHISGTNRRAAIDYTFSTTQDLSAWRFLTLWAKLPRVTGFTRCSIYVFSGSSYFLWRPYKYEAQYEASTDTYAVGWNMKMFDLDSEAYVISGSPSLAAVTSIRIRFDYALTYPADCGADNHIHVDDMRVRGDCATGESSAWLPPNSNAVFGMHEFHTYETEPFMRVYSTLHSGSLGHGRVLRQIATPEKFQFDIDCRLVTSDCWIRILWDFIDPLTGEADHFSGFLSSSDNLAGVETIISGDREYSQIAFSPVAGTWYHVTCKVDGLHGSIGIDGVPIAHIAVPFRQLTGAIGFEAYDGEFLEAGRKVAMVDVKNVEIVSATPKVSGLNEMHFSTSERHVKSKFFVAGVPAHVVLLDGYDGSDITKPLVWPWFVAG